ncbi:hypothetical protein J6590_012684 [Homalodisca vitripennis]|nr:hypothetical protein J6590_012684 [Homalodisca vitripennis]
MRSSQRNPLAVQEKVPRCDDVSGSHGGATERPHSAYRRGVSRLGMCSHRLSTTQQPLLDQVAPLCAATGVLCNHSPTCAVPPLTVRVGRVCGCRGACLTVPHLLTTLLMRSGVTSALYMARPRVCHN